ncbi:PAS domain-containing protein [Pedobacter sp. AW1-32]|uniref:PAS domain-containing sensor histidine kinase n=1 Tax=Pedobacter sp. AW1-32 TaxID=3383026 RepID=UPI003FED5CD4
MQNTANFESTEIFNIVIEESPMPIALYVGKEMIVQVANRAILSAWGKDASVIGLPLAEAVPELDGQPFLEILNQVFTTGKAYEAKEDAVTLSKDGVLVNYYFDFTYKPLKNAQGEVWAILNNATDVTDLVNTRLQIEESEELFRQMIQGAPIAIGILRGPELKIEQANDELLRVWGKTTSVLGMPLLEALPEIVGQSFPGILHQVYETGIAHYDSEALAKLEHQGLLSDYYFNFVYDPLRDKNGQVSGIMIVASEVTPQVNSRQEIVKSEDRFKNLLLEMPIATAYYETEDIIIKLANAEMLKFWGRGTEVIGHPMEKAIPELVEQPFIDILKEVFRSGKAYHADQQSAELLVDGKLKTSWFNFTYKPLRNAQGEVYAILHAAMDVTNQVMLQKQKDNFLGIASHELKTPVTSIKAYAQVLERMIRNDGDAGKADMVKKMDLQINRLTTLIGDLLDVTKIQSGRMAFSPIHFEFDELIGEIIEVIQHTTSQHEIMASLQTGATLFYDKERIGQVLINFLSNAIKYSIDANPIIVNAVVINDEVILSVQDFGVGIDTESQPFVFDQFYRVSGNLQHTYSGLGLGLFISAEIIKQEGGRIWLNSEEGKGSTFYFALKINT